MMQCLLVIWTSLPLGLVAAPPVRAWQEVPQRLPPVEELEELEEDVTELLVPAEMPAGVAPAQASEVADEPRAPARSALPGAGGERSPLQVSAFWMPAADLTTQEGDLSLVGSGLNVGFPLKVLPDGMLLATGSVHRLDIGGSAMLPDSGVPLPDELWKVQAGTMHMRQWDNGWRTGAMVSVGTASDAPFASLREMTATVVGFLNVPSGAQNAWNFSLFYAPASQIPFPIPGVAFDWHASDQVQVKIGIPFSVQYCPTEQTTLSATYMPLTNVRLLARQQLCPAWQLYGGYEVTNDTYFLADRANANDRLYFFDQRLRLGLARKLLWGLNADLSTAFIFDREIFQAASFSSDRRDVIGIESGPLGVFSIFWQR